MELSPEQQDAFQKYQEGKNVFITGPGGVGKSALIRKIFDHVKSSTARTIRVTAMTGCAALLLNCNAKTLHSWASIGLGNGTVDQLVTKIRKNKYARENWQKTDILIVDEVSMLSLKLFDLLNAIGKHIRKNRNPFGGIQLIFSGDFFQLPPVGDRDDLESQQFCFESEEWNNVFPLSNQIQFTRIYRQQDDFFASMLNQIRIGKIKRKVIRFLQEHVHRPLHHASSLVVDPTKLFPTRQKVDSINSVKLGDLQNDPHIFHLKKAKDLEMTKAERIRRLEFSDKDMDMELDFLANNLLCDSELVLKIGCQVMCTVNIMTKDETTKIETMVLCNGSQGIVTDFCSLTGLPKVKYNNGTEMVMTCNVWKSEKIPGIGVSQVPLMLAWALTIHKCQGATLDCAEIDVGSGIFECGQTYVALSRVRSLEGLFLKSFDESKIKVNRKVKDYYESLTFYHETSKDMEPISIVEEDVPTVIDLSQQEEQEESNTKKIKIKSILDFFPVRHL